MVFFQQSSWERLSFGVGVIAALVACCVSRTIHEERFHESEAIAAPTNNVALADPSNFTFGIVGDLHIGNADTGRFRRILSAAQTEGDSFMVLLGDLADQGVREDYTAIQDAVAAFGFTGASFPVLGNHDIFEDGWTHYKAVMGPSHYTFTIGNSKFIVLDTGDGTLGDQGMDWFESQLKQPRSTSHLFVASHYLPDVPGVRTVLKISDSYEALKLMKLAREHQVTAWFGAHHHSYVNENVEGVRYVCAGGAGGRRMEPVKKFFFVQVTISGTEVSYAVRDID